MAKRGCLIMAGTVLWVLTAGCGVDYEEAFQTANPRLVPQYICSGDPAPTAAVWTFPGVKGGVEFWSKGGREKLCGRVGFKREVCYFSRPLTNDDVPLRVKLFREGELVAERDANYEVLSGPRETDPFVSGLREIASKQTTYAEIERPVYIRCDPGPNGEPPNTATECTDRLDENGQPLRDESGNTIQDCLCPNEGRIMGMESIQVPLDVPAKQAIVWEVDATWFSDRIQTRAYRYQQGGVQLRLSGPGMAAPRLHNVGSGGVGNNAHPAGVWVGEVPAGQVVSTTGALDEEGNPTPVGSHLLKLTVACANQ